MAKYSLICFLAGHVRAGKLLSACQCAHRARAAGRNPLCWERLRLFQQERLTSVLLGNQLIGTVTLTQDGLFDLAGGIAGDLCKDDLLGTLITGQFQAEVGAP